METGKHNRNYKNTWVVLNRYLSEGMSFSDAMVQVKKDLKDFELLSTIYKIV